VPCAGERGPPRRTSHPRSAPPPRPGVNGQTRPRRLPDQSRSLIVVGIVGITFTILLYLLVYAFAGRLRAHYRCPVPGGGHRVVDEQPAPQAPR